MSRPIPFSIEGTSKWTNRLVSFTFPDAIAWVVSAAMVTEPLTATRRDLT